MDDHTASSSCFLSEHSVFQAMTANALLASKYFAQRQRRQSAAVAHVQELLVRRLSYGHGGCEVETNAQWVLSLSLSCCVCVYTVFV